MQAAIDKAGGASLIVVDPIVSATAADSHKNSETRRGLQPLVDMAATINAALIGVTHFTKRSEGIAPIDRVTGSVAFGAFARIVLVAAKQQDGTDGKAGPRVLMRAKSNIWEDDGGFNYELQLVPMRSRPDIIASVVKWGGVVYGKARDILAEAEATDDKDEATARHEAEDFLLDFLADGPKPAKECKAAARDAGHSPRTIDRAKSKLRIASVKDGMTGGWVWSLPEGGQHSSKNAKNANNPCQENLASFGNDGDLRGESEAINDGSSGAMGDSWECEVWTPGQS